MCAPPRNSVAYQDFPGRKSAPARGHQLRDHRNLAPGICSAGPPQTAELA
jgi:hypothetical protein